MKEKLTKMRGVFRLVYIIGAFLFAGLFALAAIGRGAAAGQFMPVLGGIIIMSVGALAVASVPILMLLNKEDIAKIIFSVLAGYWVISTGRGYIEYCQMAVEGATGLQVTVGIFGFLTGLTMLAMVAFLVLYLALGKKEIYLRIGFFLLLGTVVMAFITGILYLVLLGQVKADWSNFVAGINDSFIAPILVATGFVYFYITASK